MNFKHQSKVTWMGWSDASVYKVIAVQARDLEADAQNHSLDLMTGALVLVPGKERQEDPQSSLARLPNPTSKL